MTPYSHSNISAEPAASSTSTIVEPSYSVQKPEPITYAKSRSHRSSTSTSRTSRWEASTPKQSLEQQKISFAISQASLHSQSDYPEVVPPETFEGPFYIASKNPTAHEGKILRFFHRRKTGGDAPIPAWMETKPDTTSRMSFIYQRRAPIFILSLLLVGLIVGVTAGVITAKRRSHDDPSSFTGALYLYNSTIFSQNSDGWIIQSDISGNKSLRNPEKIVQALPQTPLAAASYNGSLRLFYVNTSNYLNSYAFSFDTKTWTLASDLPDNISLDPAGSTFLAATATSDNSTLRVYFQHAVSPTDVNGTIHELITSTTTGRQVINRYAPPNFEPPAYATPLTVLKSDGSNALRMYYQMSNSSVMEYRLADDTEFSRDFSSNWTQGVLWPPLSNFGSPLTGVAWNNWTETRLFSTSSEPNQLLLSSFTKNSSGPLQSTVQVSGMAGLKSEQLISGVEYVEKKADVDVFYLGTNKQVWVDTYTCITNASDCQWEGARSAV